MRATADDDETQGGPHGDAEDELAALRARAAEAEEEVVTLRRRLQESPRRVQTLEERLLETKGQLAQAVSQNEKLTFTLQTAKEHVAALRDEVEKLTQPPSAYGTYLGTNDDGTVDVFSGGRKMRVTLSPDIDPDALRRGNEVVLNESLNVILARPGELAGEVVVLKEVLEDGTRAIVFGRADEERVAELSDDLLGMKLRSGDTVLMESRTGLLIEKLERPEVEELVLEEVPDVTYADVGGLDGQIEAITDAVELPYLYRDLYVEHKLPAPKGILLYGPPGCGKTLIAKAVANSLAKKVAEVTGNTNTRSYFLNIKGPELLNKYVGETEGNLEHALDVLRGLGPVVVVIDEADAALGNRQSDGDSGTSARVFSMIARQMGDTRYRGKIVWMLLTSRPDLLPIDLKRQGRAEVHIPLFYPQTAQERREMFLAMAKKAKVPLEESAVPDFEKTASLSGADIGNYTVNSSATTTATINKKALTATITADDKTYDGNTNATTSGRWRSIWALSISITR